jgi:salicylate hydroxylase
MARVRDCERVLGGTSLMPFFPGDTAVLGCDGIKSRTRAIVLGESDATAAVFSGKYAYRGLIPMKKAIEIMGDADPKKNQLFLGYHGHVLTFPIANATLLNGTSLPYSSTRCR